MDECAPRMPTRGVGDDGAEDDEVVEDSVVARVAALERRRRWTRAETRNGDAVREAATLVDMTRETTAKRASCVVEASIRNWISPHCSPLSPRRRRRILSRTRDGGDANASIDRSSRSTCARVDARLSAAKGARARRDRKCRPRGASARPRSRGDTAHARGGDARRFRRPRERSSVG